MGRIVCVLWLVLGLVKWSNGQDKLSMNAIRLGADEKIEIDGIANEKAWDVQGTVDEFITRNPDPGKKASQKSEIKVLYDDQAMYVFANLLDSNPENIQKQLSRRDSYDNVDWFSLVLSPYNDGNNGVRFTVTAAGVQMDAQILPFSEDRNWNAVWESDVRMSKEGWTVEMRIPYSAIRFPEKPEQIWGVNFIRSIRRNREESSWNPIKPEVDGFLNQMGILKNIKDIKPPIRLFLYPYVSGYAEHYDKNVGTSYNGGMDLKYGINDAFTLDVTLVPDFGQVQSDNNVLNLSPFEVRFNENRQFFTEGTELFNKGGLFYSRRIGGFPHAINNAYQNLKEGEEITELPTQGKLLNATKLSGRTVKGLGVGVFNAITGNSYATITNGNEERTELIDPSTNYNVFVLDQNLPNNSSVTLINTNVTRDGGYYDANVTGSSFRLRNKKNNLMASGSGSISQQFGEELNESKEGYAYDVGFNKIGGNHNFGISQGVKSDTYDINDLGFLYNNNQFNHGINYNYSHYTPTKHLNNYWAGAYANYSMLYNPREFTGFSIGGNVGATSKKFNTFGLNAGISPIEGANYFEPRIPGRFYQTPKNKWGSFFVSSDYRKMFALDVNFGCTKFDQENRSSVNFFIAPRIRISDKANVRISFSKNNRYNEEGFATLDSSGTNSVLGRRNVQSVTNIVNYNYIFTNTMSLSLRVRHYWSTVNYKSFHALQENGVLSEENYGGTDLYGNNVVVSDLNTSPYDRNFHTFNVDLVYAWVFAPGSELRAVWKNNIQNSSTDIEESYIKDFHATMSENQLNSFSLKLLYFIDYGMLKKRS